jgi:hypothetical protein
MRNKTIIDEVRQRKTWGQLPVQGKDTDSRSHMAASRPHNHHNSSLTMTNEISMTIKTPTRKHRKPTARHLHLRSSTTQM